MTEFKLFVAPSERVFSFSRRVIMSTLRVSGLAYFLHASLGNQLSKLSKRFMREHCILQNTQNYKTGNFNLEDHDRCTEKVCQLFENIPKRNLFSHLIYINQTQLLLQQSYHHNHYKTYNRWIIKFIRFIFRWNE